METKTKVIIGVAAVVVIAVGAVVYFKVIKKDKPKGVTGGGDTKAAAQKLTPAQEKTKQQLASQTSQGVAAKDFFSDDELSDIAKSKTGQTASRGAMGNSRRPRSGGNPTASGGTNQPTA